MVFETLNVFNYLIELVTTKECYIMVSVVFTTSVASLMYSAGTSIVRL